MSVAINPDSFLKLRLVYRLTRAEWAAIIGISPRLVNYIERGERTLSPWIAQSLTDELALTPDKLKQLLAHYDATQIVDKRKKE